MLRRIEEDHAHPHKWFWMVDGVSSARLEMSSQLGIWFNTEFKHVDDHF